MTWSDKSLRRTTRAERGCVEDQPQHSGNVRARSIGGALRLVEDDTPALRCRSALKARYSEAQGKALGSCARIWPEPCKGGTNQMSRSDVRAALSGFAEIIGRETQGFAPGWRIAPLRGWAAARSADLQSAVSQIFNPRNEEETRMAKFEIRKKPEVRNPNKRSDGKNHGFGIRASDFFRISNFGFRNSSS
jgi:hypothetical protein